MRRQNPVAQPWLLFWSSAGLQGSMGCPSDMTFDCCTVAQRKVFIPHAHFYAMLTVATGGAKLLSR